MKFPIWLAGLCLFTLVAKAQDPERNYAGVWKLNSEQSEMRPGPVPALETLQIDQTGDTVVCSGGHKYKLDGTETKFPIGGGFTSASRTKWEGRALLISSAVSGPRNFSVHDRWMLSRDRNTLRIRRQVITLQGEIESNLVYQREGTIVSSATAPASATEASPAREAKAPPVKTSAAPAREAKAEMTYTLAAGTKIPLKLINSVSTKTASEGDRVYLETVFPVVAEGKVVIPPGSAVAGTVTSVTRPGRVKGKGELYLRFDSVVLPNGVTREFRARPDGLDGEANATLDREEGKIQSPGTKGSDAKKAGQAAATGAAVGSIAGSAAGRAGMGAGIGAAGGAAAGLAGVLLSRGAETVLAKGAIIEMLTDTPMVFAESELGRR